MLGIRQRFSDPVSYAVIPPALKLLIVSQLPRLFTQQKLLHLAGAGFGRSLNTTYPEGGKPPLGLPVVPEV
jgi:hypothetical protein